MYKLSLFVCIIFLGTHGAYSWVPQPLDVGICECSKVWWVAGKDANDIPPNAVVAGVDEFVGGNLYVGRAFYGNELVPGKVQQVTGNLWIAINGTELELDEFEVLTELVLTEWVSPLGTVLPHGAIYGGYNKDTNTNYYICRASHDDQWVPGKLNMDDFSCLYPSEGQTWNTTTFEVLVTSEN